MAVSTIAPLSELSESLLIRLCCDGRTDAFSVLVKRYTPLVYGFILHYVKNPQLAEDLTQETFIKAFRAIERFDSSKPFRPWLMTIATNTSKTELKRNQQREILLNDNSSEANLLENIPDDTVSENLTDVALQQILSQALQSLPENVLQALVLRHVYDMPYEEVATALQANLNTVRTWLRRGRDSLKDLLEKHGALN